MGAPRWAWWVATGLGSGRLRPAPGTWGSLAGLAFWCLLTPGLAAAGSWVSEGLFLAAPAAMTWLAVAASDRVVAETGDKDPGYIVADEWAGLWIALWPVRWEIANGLHGGLPGGAWRLLPALAIPFLAFRLFDIWKPWPIRQIQVLPAGGGIVADDVVAGFFSIPPVVLLVPAATRILAGI
ncbi:phosphatidylglycerophosphatase A family protein [Mesoterricola silvestris]|uniref:Phosphatidylglycerophosphatase A n=1 Tax=Mesoterricola silvestris TaxID=2927979 RepID=A0AA48GN81_9BACT|nr:phosphatidylglycerophosphatase A [Mesoterricola silvestris]BDU70922.1 phosphatidylglycerophosphatase A [Mesoterricola silvestris]